MSEHRAELKWSRKSDGFSYDEYNRSHEWLVAGQKIAASAAPSFKGDESMVDPEEAFVASVASCHMLTFLAICAKKRLVVNSYSDNAVGFLELNANKKLSMTRVELHPKIEFAEGSEVDSDKLRQLHGLSHKECFIANSVNCEIVVL